VGKLLLPKFGQTMEEGYIAEWFVMEGDSFVAGDDLYEVETEKANMTVEATISGTLYKILVPSGIVKIGTTVGVAVAEGEQPSPEDVAQFLGEPAVAGAAAQAAAPEPAAAGPAVARRTELAGARKAAARVVAESWREIPQFQQVIMADATNVLQARATLLARNEGGDIRISLNDVLLDRVIAAVEEVPAINASYTDGVVTEYADIDVAVAVATDHGLLTPVLRRSNKMSLADRVSALRELARRSAAGELRPEDLENPTITVSNLGMYGVDTGFALVTRPQAAVVFLGQICERPMVVDGSVTARSSLYLSVSYDHRVVDGAVAARFLSALRRSVERPGT
jgi:pyruvate dehydrogenase E2 component (dihydrolipoamide acetyltransferase)